MTWIIKTVLNSISPFIHYKYAENMCTHKWNHSNKKDSYKLYVNYLIAFKNEIENGSFTFRSYECKDCGFNFALFFTKVSDSNLWFKLNNHSVTPLYVFNGEVKEPTTCSSEIMKKACD